METLADRLRLVMATHTSSTRRFAELQELSGNAISADSWKNVWHGRQRPTVEMIELVGQRWPEHAFWLVTGIPYPAGGHEEPGQPGVDWLIGHNVGEHVYAKRVLRCRVDMKQKVDALMQSEQAVSSREEAVQILKRDQRSVWWDAGTLEAMAISEHRLLTEKLLNDDKEKR